MFKDLNRREFLKSAVAGAGMLMAATPFTRAAEKTQAFCGNDIVTLGKTGIKASRLAQGTGFNGYRRSSEHTRKGKDFFLDLVHHSVDQGITFMDMADLYGSHPFMKDSLKEIPRDKYTLLTKIWPRKEDWCDASGGATEEVNRFRKELGVDMIDICLIHCMMDDKWVTNHERVRDELSELKQKGVVRAVGVSCHHLGALKLAATHSWVDVVFARINNKGGGEYAMDGSVEDVSAVLKQARANGKVVIGMKIFGAGKLVKPEEKDASLNYVFQNELVDAITVGMLSREQVNDTLKRMSQVKKA